MSSESLWNYHREEIDDGFDDDASEGRSCKYKTKILGKNRKSLKIGVAIPLKLISKFQRFLNLPSINCEVELDLLWITNCLQTLCTNSFFIHK